MKNFLNRLVRNTCYEVGINGGLCSMCRKPWDDHFVSGDDSFKCQAVEDAIVNMALTGM